MLPGEQNHDADWLIRSESETDWDHGQRPETRSLEKNLQNGLVLIDKPAGPTSHQVSAWVRDILSAGKAGHSGTLDPKATGVLPIGIDAATTVLQALTMAGKVYVGTMELDDTVDQETIEAEAETFIGTNTQVPPEKSAVKREQREREVYDLEILEVQDNDVLFRIACEKGFYVRTFCRQFGEALGTTGAMTDLRRTQVGVFGEDRCHSLQDLQDAYAYWQDGDPSKLEDIILPVEAGIRHLKKVIVKDSAVASICHGADLGSGGIAKLQDGIEPEEPVAILTLKGELIALADAAMDAEMMLEANDTAARLRRVFMDKDLYPKAW